MLQIGLVIGGTRIASLVASLILGDLADRISARSLIISTEIIAATLSILLAWFWTLGSGHFALILSTCILRAFVLAVQQPGRNKIAKLLSEDTYLSNSRQAIWLNKVTHGAMFFSAALAFMVIKYGNFYWALGFDVLTFFLNAVIVLKIFIRPSEQNQKSSTQRISIYAKFKDLYSYSPRTAVLDLLLAIALCGGNLFTVRMAGEHEQWIPVYLTSYGLAVWVTGYLERISAVRKFHRSIWIAFSLSFLLLAEFPSQGVLTFFIFVFNDHCYWLLFHRYSSQIQTNTPTKLIGSVTSARMIQMILVLATGEFLVGAWQKHVSIFWEGAWRAIFCLVVASILALGWFKKRESNEKSVT